MNGSRSDAFLSGQGIPVLPGEVESKLAELWGPAAERAGGPDVDRPSVTRIVLANLVVADLDDGAGDRVERLVETVAARHPSRALVLRRSDHGGRRVSAEVSAVCHLPAPGRPQVCAEKIVLRAGPDAIDLLPGAVRPLLETDLPLVLWWHGDPRSEAALYLSLADEASRVILDLPDPFAGAGALGFGLDPALNPFGRDLVWFGMTPWRELVAQFFDPPGAEEALARLSSVRIEAEAQAAPGTAPPRASAWLAAWLAGRLGWTPSRREVPADGLVRATFAGPSGEVVVDLATATGAAGPTPRVLAVTLEADDRRAFRLTRLVGDPAEGVRVEFDAPGSRSSRRVVRAPEWDDARRVAAALESDRDDPPYRSALPIALWLVGA